jgi:hypothetical protein
MAAIADLAYFDLPIQGDEGFPQAFRLAFNNALYSIALYVNTSEADLQALPDDGFLELGVQPPGSAPMENGFMVMRVTREAPSGPQVIFFRKLVPNLAYPAVELGFWFGQIHIAKLNINGVGAFGSQVQGHLAARWAL